MSVFFISVVSKRSPLTSASFSRSPNPWFTKVVPNNLFCRNRKTTKRLESIKAYLWIDKENSSTPQIKMLNTSKEKISKIIFRSVPMNLNACYCSLLVSHIHKIFKMLRSGGVHNINLKLQTPLCSIFFSSFVKNLASLFLSGVHQTESHTACAEYTETTKSCRIEESFGLRLN